MVEIAIVVTVIAILASMIVVSFINVQKRARDDTRVAQIKAVNAALKRYYDDNGEYPSVCSGPNIDCALSNLSSALVPAYMPSIPASPPDSQGRNYLYIRGTAADSYGIFIPIESSSPISAWGWPCKTGNNIDTNWWGGGYTPSCPF